MYPTHCGGTSLNFKKRSAVVLCLRQQPGRALDRNAVRLQVDRIKKRCHLADDVCAYMIRHTFATWALMRGVDAASLAEIFLVTLGLKQANSAGFFLIVG